jgi:hypothetical protein
MTACFRDGSVVEVLPLPEKDFVALAAVQRALDGSSSIAAPLSRATQHDIRRTDPTSEFWTFLNFSLGGEHLLCTADIFCIYGEALNTMCDADLM